MSGGFGKQTRRKRLCSNDVCVTNRNGARKKMKASAIRNGIVAATCLLSCAACTQPQTNQSAQRTSAGTAADRTARFTKFQLTNLVVISHGVPFASKDLFVRAMSIAPQAEKIIQPCGTPPPNATRIVKIRINNNFDVKDTGRDIVSKLRTGGGVKTVPEPAIIPQRSTTYDLKFNKTDLDQDGQIVAVKIILKDDDLIFLDNDHAITTVDSTPSMFMCLASVQPLSDKDDNSDEDSVGGGPKWDTATMYIDSSVLGVQKFNIRVIALHKDKVHALPMILDPEVENNGFNSP